MENLVRLAKLDNTSYCENSTSVDAIQCIQIVPVKRNPNLTDNIFLATIGHFSSVSLVFCTSWVYRIELYSETRNSGERLLFSNDPKDKTTMNRKEYHTIIEK